MSVSTALPDDPEQMLRVVMGWISRVPDAADRDGKANAFIGQMPPGQMLKGAAALSFANPLFLPNLSEQTASSLELGINQFAQLLTRAKLTAHHDRHTKLLVACAPKSASTFIQTALRAALDLPDACLFTATYDWASAAALGAALKEQEPDELSLLRNGLNGRGYVAQHHARCSPYMARMLRFYNVRPILTHRNIFDTLVSMDDMVLEWRSRPSFDPYFSDALPGNYHRLERDDRMMILAHRWAPWLVQFYVSWKKCERAGHVAPLWISYEKDFLGSKLALAVRIAEFVGGGANASRILAALEDKSNGAAKRINKGIAGRGEDLPVAVRDHVLAVARAYRDEEDLSPLVGEGLGCRANPALRTVSTSGAGEGQWARICLAPAPCREGWGRGKSHV